MNLIKYSGQPPKKKKPKKEESGEKILSQLQQKSKTVLTLNHSVIKKLKMLLDIPFREYTYNYSLQWFFDQYDLYQKEEELDFNLNSKCYNLNHHASFYGIMPFSLEIVDAGNGIIAICLKEKLMQKIKYAPPDITEIKLKLVTLATVNGESENELVDCSQSFSFKFDYLADMNKPFKPIKLLFTTGGKSGNIVVIAASLHYIIDWDQSNPKYKAGALLAMGKLK